MSPALVPPLLPPLYVLPSAPLLPPLGPERIRFRRPPEVPATESLPPAEQYAASPLAGLVAHFTALVAEPGTPAGYIDANNVKVGTDGQQAAARSGRAYFVTVKATMLVIDCDDGALIPVLDELAALLRAERLEPIRVGSGGADRQHLFGLIDDPRTMRRYVERIRGLGYAPRLEVRSTIRPPLSPHRRGKPVRLLSPEDPAEAIAALTPRLPKPLAPKWMQFLRHGAPEGQRSEQIQGLALAAVNAGWTFGQLYQELMNPTHHGGAKIQNRPDAERYLEHCWESAEDLARRRPPVRDRSIVLALIAGMRRRVETWPWPKRAGETYRRVLTAYLTLAERSGKLVFAASVREVADLAGVSIRAVADATKWLQYEGWLRLHKGYQRGTTDAASWRVKTPSCAELSTEQVRRLALAGLRRPSRDNQYQTGRLGTVTGTPHRDAQENADTGNGAASRRGAESRKRRGLPALSLATESVTGTPQSDVRAIESVTATPHDLWRAEGLGTRAGGLYRLLDATTPVAAKELALKIGCRPQAVRRQLVGKLGRHGLAVQDLKHIGWLRGDGDLDLVAAELGVAGKGAAQREEHQRQRETFRDRLAGGDLRRRKDGR
jgi:hypothetical protein